MEMNPKEIDTFKRRSEMYYFLAEMYAQEPTVEGIEALKNMDMGRTAFDLEKIQNMSQFIEELEIEFTRLFLGPGPHQSPHESVQAKDGDGKIWGKKTALVKNIYQAYGLDLSEKHTHMPDHISIELEFMGKLLNEIALCGKNLNDSEMTNWSRVSNSFFKEHIKNWIPQFSENILEKTDHNFYKGLAKLTIDFLDLEDKDFQSLASYSNAEC